MFALQYWHCRNFKRINMKLFTFKKIKMDKKKRVGRGIASGKGKTAGRGTKGQKSRTGYNIPRRFEGGQTSLISRLPKKKGFKSRKTKTVSISLNQIQSIPEKSIISPKILFENKILDKKYNKVKLLDSQDKKVNYKFRNIILSKNLSEKINRTHCKSPLGGKQERL